jgi:thiol:disulfide interchange protein DsbD
MRFLLRSVAVAAALALGVPSALAQAKGKHTLLLSHEAAKPGDTVTAAIRQDIPFEWHTYYKSPGESGQPTELKWTLPPGISAGDIQWPVPHKSKLADLVTYEFSGEVLLLVPLKVSAAAPRGAVTLAADVRWLECEAQGLCIPGKGSVSATLTIGSETKPSANAKEIEDARKIAVQPGTTALRARAGWEKPASGDKRPLILEWAVTGKPALVDFFPITSEADKWEIAHTTDVLPSEPGTARVRKLITKKSEGGAWPSSVTGLFVHRAEGADHDAALEFSVPIEGGGTSKSASTGAPTAAIPDGGAGATVAGGTESLGKMLWFAFLGGMILNIMPCVFPVIALKILGFVNQSKEDPRRVFHLGVIYSLGVVASFLVMAGMVIAVQQTGKAASWGMQMQNPQFTTVLTVLMTLVALNLFGVFEVTASGAVGAAGQLAHGEGASGAFFNGVLAVVLATPCTAPFLAPALGFAFAQPPLLIILFFVLVGAGLAAPYLVLSWQPAWVKLLPRPGAWMERFKVAMGFPMLATAIWLFSFTARRFGSDGPLWLALFLVIVALAAWVFGEFVQRGTQRRGIAAVVCVLLLAGGYVKALEDELHWRSPAKNVASAGADPVAATASPDKLVWAKWSADAVAKARAEGRVVLVDFTADWCLTCKANLRTSIDIASTRKKLAELNAVTLIGDNTDEDPAIIAELKKFGRAGVPLVLVYPRDAAKPPLVLPAFLTPSIIHDALDKAK